MKRPTLLQIEATVIAVLMALAVTSTVATAVRWLLA